MKIAFEKSMIGFMENNDKIVLLTADEHSSELTVIRDKFPSRCFSFGIAECNMVSAAAGLSRSGFIPVVYTVASFLAFRAFEAIRCDVCINKFKVILVGFASGVKINNFGPAHHAIEDIAVLRSLPELIILSPASVNEVNPVLNASFNTESPVYIRLGKAFEAEIFDTVPSFIIGKSDLVRKGDGLTVICTGNIISNALEAVKLLEEKFGVSSDVINISSIKPIDKDIILSSAAKTHKVVTVEEHQVIGGVGSAVSEVLARNAVDVLLETIGFNDEFCTAFGWHRDLLEAHGLSSKQIFDRIKKFLDL